MLFSVQEKPCGAGVWMRCEGLVDRAAWRMSGVDEVRVGSWSVFFFFFFLISNCFLLSTSSYSTLLIS